MSKKSSNYEITTLGQFIAVVVVLGIVSIFFPIGSTNSQNSTETTKVTEDNVDSQSQNKQQTKQHEQPATQTAKTPPQAQNNTKQKNTKTTAPKPNPKVVGYKEPRQKSAYVRKHHDMDVVRSTNYSKMAPLKNPRSPSEKWVMDRIKKYSKNLPRILLQDYGDDGYYINTIGQDAVGRYIIPGINPDGEWSTVLYSNTNRQGKRIKMILGHNWRKWKDQGFYIHAIYVSNKTISLRNKAGKNLASSIYPVNQSLSKGPVFRFR